MNEELFLSDDEIDYKTVSFPEPRPFQASTHERLKEGAKAGHQHQMIMAPTGGGKTYLGMQIAHKTLEKGFRALFVCDRTTLINQTSEVADSYGLSAHGVIQSNHWRTNPRHRLQIASVQTLARRQWPVAEVVIIDEAHCQYAAWVEYIKKTRSRVIGLSATPFSKGLGLLFSNLVNAATMDELTKSGVLVPMKTYSCTRIDMTGAETQGKNGEWTDSAAANRGMEIVGDVVKEWMEYASDRKTIVFGATVAHCEEIARQFNESGIQARVFSCHTKEEERLEILKEYKKPDSAIRVLISVEALAKGFDVKDVSCVCDCRPLRKSLSTAIQMWGRGLRSSPETGKTDCVLLDFSGNIIRFAEDFSEIFFNGLDALDAGEKLDKTVRQDNEEDKEPKGCPKCGAIPFVKKCMSCGFEIKSQSLIEHLPGAMREVMIGKSVAADSPLNLYEQVCTYARQHGNPETQRQRAWHLYKEIMGEPPTWAFDAVVNKPISRAVMNKIQQKKIAYLKAISKGRAA